jgi:hypothetical protein
MGAEQLCDGGPLVTTNFPESLEHPVKEGERKRPEQLSQGDLLRYQAFNAKAIKNIQEGNPGAALPILEEALGILRDPAVLNNYGDALARSGRLEDALKAFDESISISPDYAQAHYNRGVVLDQLDRWEEGREAYLKSIASRVTGAACNNAGNDCQYTLRLAESESLYRMAIKHGWQDARWNMSLALMMQGKWREGWDWYHWRPQMNDFREHEALWKGESLKDKVLVILTEQGLGDSIYALRYLPVLRQMGLAQIVVGCEKPLIRLVQAMCPKEAHLPDVTVIDRTTMQWNQPFHYLTLAMSLPGYLTPDGTGPNTPYLKATGIKTPGKLTVGLCWNGSTVVGPPKERNIPLSLLEPLLDVPGLSFVSLQKGNAVDEIEGSAFKERISTGAIDQAKDVYDTACIVASCDIVISVDTLIPHVAGALGVPCWLMNRYMSCWQWGTPVYDPCLYSTVAQFRQEKPRDWSRVIEQIRFGLMNVVNQAGLATFTESDFDKAREA